MRAAFRTLAGVVVLGYVSWLGMMIVHEAGHILHAWLSGGRVVDVRVPLAGFSQTIVHPNPRELFVVWGGPVWGVMIPVIGCAMFRLAIGRVPETWKFFAGFCLLANGAYIGAGIFLPVGDARDLLRLGVPKILTVSFGAACVIAGLAVWHRTSFLSRKKPVAVVLDAESTEPVR